MSTADLSVPSTQISASGSGLVVVPATREFMRKSWRSCLLVSLLVVVPCFWHRSIQAGDLGSHVYNAWLAQLIHTGKLPGLWMVPQWSNTLFDRLLYASIQAFGFSIGERLVVSLAVLIFFWGTFALASAAAGRSALMASPAIAALSYGYIFSMGFFNFYISVGLAFLMLAVIWRGRGRELLLAPPLFVLISMAHPLGVVAALGLGAYLCFTRVVRNWMLQAGYSASMVAVIFAARSYASSHYYEFPRRVTIGWMMGADQWILYGHSYFYLAIAFLVAAVVIAVSSVVELGIKAFESAVVWLFLLAQVSCAVALLPGGYYTPAQGPMGFLPERISLFGALALCCILAIFTRRAWQSAILVLTVAGFFGLYYTDTGKLDHVEQMVEVAVKRLPPGSRIVSGRDVNAEMPDARVSSGHMLDRACIGYCFDYANYEAGSKQFRIRGGPGNGFVVDSYEDSIKLQMAMYVPTPSDPPLYYLGRCGNGNGEELCFWQYGR
jgi:hypothetical protein